MNNCILTLAIILLFGFSLSAQEKIKLKHGYGVADETLVFTNKGNKSVTIKFVENPKYADILVNIGKIKRRANIETIRRGKADKTYLLKSKGFGDFQYKIVEKGDAQIKIYRTATLSNSDYIYSFYNLSQREIVASLHNKIKNILLTK